MRFLVLRILYVDDDPDLREIALLGLEQDPDIEARAAANGTEALDVLTAWPAAIILLDVRMPGMDGPAFLKRVRQGAGFRRPAVVFVTAASTASERAALEALRPDGLILKPFNPMRLAEIARNFAGA